MLRIYSQDANLAGKVIDAATRHPISRALIVLMETGQQKNSDDNGRFIFDRLGPGRFSISVRHIAFAGIERTIILTPGMNDTIIIEMHPAIFPSDEVIIRSTRTYSSVKNNLFPLNTVSSEQLSITRAATISEALTKDPGISLVRDGIWETAVSIRGMSRSNIISLIDNARIETANDIAGALSLLNANDLERVETIKTSGSVLYGTGALGGVVHFVTKRPSFTDVLRINADLTSGLTGVDGGISHHLALEGSSNLFAARISGGYRTAGNTSTPGGMLANSHYNDFSILGTVGIKTVGEQALFLSYQRSQADDTGIPGGSAFGANADVRYLLARRELYSADYKIPHISAYMPNLIVRTSRQVIDRKVEIRQGDTLRITPHAVHTTNSAQIEVSIIPAAGHLLVIGADAWQRELDSRREKSLLNRNILIGERPIPHSTYFSGGLYAQDEWTVDAENLTVTAGARYDWIRIKNDEVYNPEYSITAGVLRTNNIDSTILWQNGSARNKSWSVSCGAQYKLCSSFDIVFLAATAFRSPSLEERYQYLDLGKGNIQVGNPDLLPERSVSINTGLRYHIEGFKFQADFFTNELRNRIQGIPGLFNGRSALISANIGEARLYGYEISAEKKLSSWSGLKAWISYLRGEDTHNNTNLPQIAPLMGMIEINGSVKDAGTLSFICSAAAAQNNLAAGEKFTAGYAVFEAGFITPPLTIGQCSIIIRTGIKNLFNKAYQNHLSTLRGLLKDEPGRNFYLNATMAI
ncbi:MAG: TonB-dependent receptor [Bacteroidetes bacterium]|nr:TonB-dependent receptor [Bacteroidota bacterium]